MHKKSPNYRKGENTANNSFDFSIYFEDIFQLLSCDVSVSYGDIWDTGRKKFISISKKLGNIDKI